MATGTRRPILYDTQNQAFFTETNPGAVVSPGSTTIQAGSFDVPTTAGALPDVPGREVILQANPSNADNVAIGTSAAQPLILTPGQFAPPLRISNLNLLYAVAAATGNSLSWLVRS